MRHFFSRWQMAMLALTMKYALGTVFAFIYDQPVATREALLLCDGPGSEHQVTQQALVGIVSCTDALSQPPQHAPCAEGWTESPLYVLL